MPGPYTGKLLGFPPGYGWSDMTVPGVSAGVGASAPGVGPFIGNIRSYYFRAGQTDELHAVFHPNHDYRAGSNIYAHVHWAPSSVNTGVVEWSLEYSFARMQQGTGPYTYDIFPAPSTIKFTQAGCGSAKAHQVAESAPFLPTNFETDGLLMVRLYRAAGSGLDTFTGDAYVLTFDLHYERGQWATGNRVRGDGWDY